MEKVKKYVKDLFRTTSILFISLLFTVGLVTFALTYPMTTPGVSGGKFMDYFNKILVDTGSTSDGMVKKAKYLSYQTCGQNQAIKGFNNNGTLQCIDIPQLLDGECGSSNGQTLQTKPTTNLCLSGNASVVTGAGPWNWTCNGSLGGANSNCSANINFSRSVKSSVQYVCISTAKTYCDNLSEGGFTDWRLPTYNEIYSLKGTSSGVYCFIPNNPCNLCNEYY